MNIPDYIASKNRTFIRPFGKGDIGLLYAEYQDGDIDLPAGMDAAQFLKHIQALLVDYDTHWIVEDSGRAIAYILIKSDGWMIEPHVDTFSRASKAAIYRGYMTFFRDVALSNTIGSCLIRTLEDTKHVFERLCRHNMISFVGQIPNGDPRGTVFLYCTNPNRSR